MVPFLTLENIHVFHSGNEALKDLSLQVNEGEHWAFTGRSGSGKTTLLETIAGKHAVRGGNIRHHYYERYLRAHPVTDPYFNYKKLVAEVSHQHHFRNRSGLQEFYYQQRFNSADADEALSVRDYLAASGDTRQETQDSRSRGTFPAPEGSFSETETGIIHDLHLEHLLDRSLIKLSNGETRRLMFAAALVKRPRLLLLDAPFTGLDVAARPYFHRLINRLIASGITVIMATSEREIPEGITHVVRLEKGRLNGIWKKEEFREARRAAPASPDDPYVPRNRPANNYGLAGDEDLFRPDVPGTSPERIDKPLEELLSGPSASFRNAVLLRNVSVRYGETQVLDQISWEVERGARWALSGHNGAGKSTLLSLINADNPQAYANDIVLFDRKRGSGESIWDIKKKIGYVSPELHQYFKTADTCLEVVLSGLFDTLGLIRKVTPEQRQRALSWLQLLGLEAFRDQPFRRSPLSTQRLALIARALIKTPPLLILDEPCQGMDDDQVQTIRNLVDAVCRISGTTLIYVSHYAEEIPASVDHLLQLENGKVIYSGPRRRIS